MRPPVIPSEVEGSPTKRHELDDEYIGADDIMTTVKRQEALSLLKILEDAGYEARLVGGCVRDELLHREPKDYDIASSATPDEMLALFTKKRLRCLVHGKEHGTITVLKPHGPVEVTTLREDVETDGRRANVSFHSDFESDARRRDFTINAMSLDSKGKLHDYFEGRKHLKEKRMVFVGDPEQRIQEDYLRILRFFRFKARFALKADKAALVSIAKNVQGLEKVSRERITYEVDQIFRCETLENALQEMTETGVLAFVFPGYKLLSESECVELARCIEALAKIPEEWRSQSRLAVLFWFMHLKKQTAGTLWKEFELTEGVHLHLSNKEKNLIVHLVEAGEGLSSVKSSLADKLLFVDRFDGKEALFLQVVVPFLKVIHAHDAALKKILSTLVDAEKKHGARRKPISIQGQELMTALEIPPGKLVGEALFALRYAYLNGEWESKQEGLHWAKKHLGFK